MQAVRELHDGLLPVAEVVWIDERLHGRATAAMFAAGRQNVSLVDWLSFELMRARRIRHAFTYDRDFAARGFLPV
jgi:predicted nucleic acid-binding protein